MEGASTGSLSENIRSALSRHADVRFAYLFGSTAKGEDRADSDVDVAIFLGSERDRRGVGSESEVADRLDRARRALALEGELERALGRPVQVVALDDAPLGLVHNVLRSGRLVFSSDYQAYRRFFVSHARRYYDMEPARRVFDRYRKIRIEEGSFGGRGRDGS